ncbi:allantoinase AllB [Deinococcus apachensis]|uniref:allantoinase AllB n=1 Tax=Deinococcus apachensis TaxID=309886 RepID=UPI00036C1638|nr:allantoinase AllB [Deinococcus apachensis]
MGPELDLIVRGGTLVTARGVGRADIGVAGGQVVEVAPEITQGARGELDARGLHVFPGVIDAHVHFNEPGRTDWEGLATGSRALAAGGGTLFVDMPLNSTPPTVTRAAFEEKRALAEAKSVTDFALWGGLVPGMVDHLPDLAQAGAVGFKAFMSHSGIADFSSVDDGTLEAGLRAAAALDLPVAVHAESDELTARLAAALRSAGRTDIRAYLDSRPVAAEVEAITRACALAHGAGARLHIVHVSSGAGVAEAVAWRARGTRVTVETCPHYLTFTEEDVERVGATLKCAPPLRAGADLGALWTALREGRVDTVGSDHSPSPADLKDRADFFEVWGGIAGVQSTLAALLTGAEVHDLPLPRVAEVLGTAPARVLHLPGKGDLAPGFDADLTLVDPGRSPLLTRENLYDRHKLSPYAGRVWRGEIRRTLVRGRTVWDGQGFAEPGLGRLARPGPALPKTTV